MGEKLGGTGRNSEGMGGVRVFSGGVSDRSCGSGGKRWDLEKERVAVGLGGDGSVGVVRADRELGKERVVGAVRAVGTVGGDENKRGCPKSFS